MNTQLLYAKKVYDQPEHRSKEETDRALASKDIEKIVNALIGASLNEPDRKWVEARLISHATHGDARVRRAVVTGAGHIARLHRMINPRLIAAVKSMADEPALAGAVSDALDDIQQFTGGV